MKTNASGQSIIKDAEAGEGILAKWPATDKKFPGRFKYLSAYLCPANIPTIGWGHTGPDVTLDDVHIGTTISVAKAQALFDADLQSIEARVLKMMTRKGRVPTENQFSAFVSLGFNIGVTALDKSTAMKRFLNGDTHERVVEAMCWFNKGRVNGKLVVLGGLILRRGREGSLFLTKDGYTTPKPVGNTPVHEAKPPTVGRLIVAAGNALARAA